MNSFKEIATVIVQLVALPIAACALVATMRFFIEDALAARTRPSPDSSDAREFDRKQSLIKFRLEAALLMFFTLTLIVAALANVAPSAVFK